MSSLNYNSELKINKDNNSQDIGPPPSYFEYCKSQNNKDNNSQDIGPPPSYSEITRKNNSQENQSFINPTSVITQQPSFTRMQYSNDDDEKCCSSTKFCDCMEVTCQCFLLCLECFAACA